MQQQHLPLSEIVGDAAAAAPADQAAKDKPAAPGLKAPAKVMVFQDAWEHIDLEGQHPAAAAAAAAKPQPKKGFAALRALKPSAVLRREFWSRRRLLLVLLLLAVLALALGLGIGLGTRGTAGGKAAHGGKARSTYKPRTSSVLPAAARKVTAAEAGDTGQLSSLLQLKAALDPGGVLDKKWTEEGGRNRGYCSWKYIGCDSTGEVVEMVNLTTDSYVMVLTGTLPPAAAFKGLPGLRVIDIRMNAIKGGLPADWGTLAGQLEVIKLSQNFLNGTLPESWAKLGPSLKELSLWDNDLSGTLPEAWEDLVVMEKLDLSYNGLEGPLPDAWAGLGSKGTGLRELLLDVNQLTGPLPEAWGALTSLQHLLVSENRLEGPLPDVGAQWPAMRELWAEYNGFEGPLPESWGKMSHLEKLALNDNALKGTVWASFANL
uniref:Leucine-rich repeat-containing N-terminal plant-type domain-containing protein n=1 Tax=Tetradesmus obliquus TaxID=3088 RepID=A0A383VP39_TETOB|eukprot:jgi/Sobl393_1/9123/SZX67288.1